MFLLFLVEQLSRDPKGSRDNKVRRKAVFFTIHFADEATVIEAKAPNFKTFFSEEKDLHTLVYF